MSATRLGKTMTRYEVRVHQLIAGRFARKRGWRTTAIPMISFTFDDFPRSALAIGGKMLADYGWRGTYYGAMRLMGAITSAGPMFSRVDLDQLLSAGHELACHTSNHESCLSVGTKSFIGRCVDNCKLAASTLGGYQLRNFSFPHGHVTLPVKRVLRLAYDTCRSIEPGINSDPADLGFLRANAIYSRLGIETTRELIRANARASGWLILYTHDVAANPSPYGCTPQYFEEVLRCARESGADVLTMREAASRYQLCG